MKSSETLFFAWTLVVVSVLAWVLVPRSGGDDAAPEQDGPPGAGTMYEPALRPSGGRADRKRRSVYIWRDDPQSEPWPAYYTEDDAPPDPLPEGEATATLRLIARGTGEPVPGQVDLWWLDAPGTEFWEAGGKFIGRARADQAGRVRFDELVPGTYRVRAFGRARGAGDPKAFRVRGPEDEVTLEVEVPEPVALFVAVFDEHGTMASTARVRRLLHTREPRPPGSVPTWANPRAPRDGRPLLVSRNLGYGSGKPATGVEALTGRGEEAALATAESGGLPLPGRHGPEAFATWVSAYEVALAGRTPVSVHVDKRVSQGPRTFVAASLPLRALHDAVRLPDGRRAVDAGAEFSAKDRARLVPLGARPPPWTELSVQIEVRLKGYRTLRRRVSLGEPLPAFVLRARRAK